MKPSFELKQSQNLTMTPRLQQAIKMLQMSHLELNDFVNQHVEDNPLLQKDSDEYAGLNDDFSSFEHADNDEPESLIFEGRRDFQDAPDAPTPQLKSEISLQDYVSQQWHLIAKSELERKIGDVFIDALSPDGYFHGDIMDMAQNLQIPISLAESILKKLQTLEPVGIFARNLSECMTLQLLDRGLFHDDFERLLQHLDMLVTHGLDKLARACRLSVEDIQKHLKTLKTLTAKPGYQFSTQTTPILIPDILVRRKETILYAELNPDALPHVFVNSEYFQNLKKQCQKCEDLSYLSTQMNHANWLVNALEQRSLTVLRVSQEILKQQQDFFEKGVRFLKPLSLKDIADAIDMHESTISRVTTNKYMTTPLGVFELKFFFSSKIGTTSRHTAPQSEESVSSKNIMDRMRELITQEDPKSPLSDDNIAILMKNKGFDVARRTIAKYRGVMGVPSSSQRRHINRIHAK